MLSFVFDVWVFLTPLATKVLCDLISYSNCTPRQVTLLSNLDSIEDVEEYFEDVLEKIRKLRKMERGVWEEVEMKFYEEEVKVLR